MPDQEKTPPHLVHIEGDLIMGDKVIGGPSQEEWDEPEAESMPGVEDEEGSEDEQENEPEEEEPEEEEPEEKPKPRRGSRGRQPKK